MSKQTKAPTTVAEAQSAYDAAKARADSANADLEAARKVLVEMSRQAQLAFEMKRNAVAAAELQRMADAQRAGFEAREGIVRVESPQRAKVAYR